jgi:osmotically inducible protein OsmC
MSGASGHLNAPFTFATRFEGAAGGTNPEELIGAAQAGCFSMFLAAQLTEAGHPPTSIDTTATVQLGAGPTVTKIELDTVAVVPGVSKEVFDEKVDFSKKNCPISKALAAIPEVTFKATLKS